MKVTVAPTTFGAVGIADVEEYLPQILTEREKSSQYGSIELVFANEACTSSYWKMLHHYRHDGARFGGFLV